MKYVFEQLLLKENAVISENIAEKTKPYHRVYKGCLAEIHANCIFFYCVVVIQ